MKKNILLSALCTLLFAPIFAQSPGGVSAASSNQIWLDANQLTLNNGDKVASWTDFSGNGKNATQATLSKRPTFSTNQVNSKPAITFNPAVQTSLITSAISGLNTNQQTVFIVSEGSAADHTGFIYGTNYSGHLQFSGMYRQSTIIKSFTRNTLYQVKEKVFSNLASYNIVSNFWNGSSLSVYRNSTLLGSVLGADCNPTGHLSCVIGADPSNPGRYGFNGKIAEIIWYSSVLNSAEHKIVNNYLAAKYNLAISSDIYAYEGTHGNNLIGIGQEADGSNLSAKGISTLQMSNMSTPGNGDYVLIGDDGVGLNPLNSIDVPAVGWSRYGKVWRSDITGTPGTVDITFDLSTYSIGFPDSYVLLVDGDGVFAAGASPYAGVYDGVSQTVTFTGVTLADGNYLTLANNSLNIQSTGITADWHTTTTWNCGCIPGLGSHVEIMNGHTVNINGQNANTGSLTITGTLTFSSTDTLTINQSYINTGTLTAGAGAVSFTFTGGAQTIDGTQGFNNLIIDNTSGVAIASGTSTIQGFLDVKTGSSFSTNNALTMLSNAAGSGAFKNPSTGTIVGNVTVQRYLNEGDSWYLLASPLTNATIEDWNMEVEMQGFAGTEWPTANYSSVYYYTETLTGPTQDNGYQIPTNTSNITTNTRGYDIYIATDGLGSVPRMIDQTGAPKLGDGIVINGTYNANIGDPSKDGWNLVGNPYQSPVKYANVTKGGSYDVAYRKIGTGGSAAINGVDMISPGEGFWLHCLGGPCSLTFDAADVNTTNIDNYNLKTVQQQEMVIKLNYDNSYDEVLLGFNENATNNYDLGLDGYKLNNSFNYKPNLSIVNQENHDQYIGIFNKNFNDIIPLRIYTENPSGVEKNYSLSFENVDFIKQRNKQLILEDRQLNTFTPITENMNVDFTMFDNVTQPRFYIHVNSPLLVSKQDITCYNQNNGKITVELDGSQSVDVICYDEFMNVIATRSHVNTSQTINNLQAGAYKIEVNNMSIGNVSDIIIISEPMPVNSTFDVTISEQMLDGFSSSTNPENMVVNVGQLLKFNNSSINATSNDFDFGDMISSNLESPEHIYFNPGLYKVTLTSKNGACESTSFKTIQVNGATSISETNLLDAVNVLNVENDIFVNLNNQNNTGNVKFEVLNAVGQVVYSSTKAVGNHHVETIHLDEASGLYLLTIEGFGYSKTKKIVLN